MSYHPVSKFQKASVTVTIRTPKDTTFSKVSDFVTYWYDSIDIQTVFIYQRKGVKAFTFKLTTDTRNAKEDLKHVVDYLKDNAPLKGWSI